MTANFTYFNSENKPDIWHLYDAYDTCILLYTPLRVFQISISWLFLTRVWVTASFLKFPGLSSVSWPILIKLLSSYFQVFSPFTNPLGIVPSTPTTIGIIATFMFHCFFSSLAWSRHLSLFSLSFIFTLWSAEIAKSFGRFSFLGDYRLVWLSGRD